ncbi:MAG: TlpA disulfide reductase family protein [Myxococcota bacterium]|nr:TlpA disulfide reductase family protein [Myxococcota bacterium]
MLFLLFASFLSLAAPEMIPEEDVELTGRSAPDFSLKTLDGNEFRLSDHRGQVVVLSFWASWCGPCRFELPELSRIKPLYPNTKFIAVNVDRERSEAERFLKRVQFDLPIVWDNQAMALGEYSVVSMPTMFLIDKNGTVQYVKVGYSRQKKLAELESKIKELQQ